ncbi:T9SS type A sorting domain-containing protein [Hymenobacter sp. RP-2-7]|uniref:T9SS type A sorting domain-containing protein n=1 Tax=Hymenobacter polaris TaxID=2682546 RepID=A0A7Y0FPS8_9BACT|nr:Ig-like domain-containing protein [Hymenobacter polaris]NML67709.1 T9SS type A sorting domain-containing protein [Hymenobacter polaris]
MITKGGTYTGNYQSLSSDVPCILVNTNQPVILDGCNLSGAGHLIQSGSGANLTVRNCTGVALTPSTDNTPPGHFLDTYQSRNLVVEHNTLTGTTGIVVNRWQNTGTGGTLTVRYNVATNIDGRWRNGTSSGGEGFTRASFLQLNTVLGLADVDIAFNQVLNTPDKSRVEDNINFYNSSGTAGSPLHVHDNFVRGGYPVPATAAGYTGSGLTTDGDANTAATASAYLEADHNQFVGVGNAAMNIAAGHDIYYHDNRLVSSGLLPNGQRFYAGFTGIGVFNYYQQLASVFFNQRVENNTIGYVRWGGHDPYDDRQDLAPDACAPCAATTIHLPNPITLDTENQEWLSWLAKVQQNNVTLGPLNAGNTPAPTPTPTPTAGTIANPGFEADNKETASPTGWQKTIIAGIGNPSYTETYGTTHSGTYHGTHYSVLPYEVYTYQVVTGLANGTYRLQAWVRSGGGQAIAQMQAKNYGGAQLSTAIGATPGNSWVQVSLGNIAISNGQCEIGFYSKATSSQWIYFDDVTLVATQNTAPTVSLAAASTSLTLGQGTALTATAADADGSVAKVEFFNGTTKLGEDTATPYVLNWTPTAAGTYSLTAIATDDAGASTTSGAITVTVTASAPTPAPTPAPVAVGGNLVVNPSFEADGQEMDAPTGWQKTLAPGTDNHSSYSEAYGGSHSGSFHGTQWRPEGYEVYTYQVINNVPAGTYRLRAWVRGSGGQATAIMLAKNYGGGQLSTPIGASISDWQQIEITNINVTSGTAEIGFYSKASKNQWIYFDDVELVALPATPTPTTAANTVLNASFDDDQAAVLSPRQWKVQTGSLNGPWVSYTESYGGAHTGTYHGTHYSLLPYEIYTNQGVKKLPNGTYNLKAWVKGDIRYKAQLRASNYGGPTLAADIASSADWVQVSVLGITVSNGQCEVGFYSNGPGGQWLYFDDVELTRQDAGSPADNLLMSSSDPAASGLGLYPNPANSQTSVTGTFAQNDNVTITVIDYQGTQLAQFQRTAVAGSNEFTLDTSSLPSGTYTLRVVSSSQPVQVLNLAVVH